jgi:nucleoside-diphosphate-sugar epimerase
MLRAMRIAVTGASGFVGRALVPALEAARHDVIDAGRDVTGDIAAFGDWPRVLAGADAVVHLAALAHERGVDEARLRAVNVEAAAAIGRAAAASGARMVFLSSVKALGEETVGLAFDETSPLAPRDAYGRAKADAERALLAIEGLRLTILRPPLAYGPGVKANFLSLVKAIARGLPLPLAAVRNGRSLVFVGNLADAIARCLEAKAAGKTYLVCDGPAVSTPELCRALGRALGRPGRLFPFPPALLELAPAMKKLTRSLEVSDRALRRELGWSPPFTFEEGIRRTAEWYQKGPE